MSPSKALSVMPKEINFPNVIGYLKEIYPERWCVDIRGNDHGQRCVLGHLDVALKIMAFDPLDVYSASGLVRKLGIEPTELAAINNGTTYNGKPVYEDWIGKPEDHPYRTEPIDGESIKNRVIKYLEEQYAGHQHAA